MPLIPGIVFWYESRGDNAKQALTAQLHAPPLTPDTIKPGAAAQPADRLVIPAMLLETPYYSGPDARTLNKGPWLRPGSSPAGKDGNIIIAAHRFTYTNPRGEFYHLDKLKIGDEIGLFRDTVRQLYIVREIKVVPATQTSIEAPTTKPQLTLYTCTPLWMPKDRLVIIATPQSAEKRDTGDST